MDAKITLGVKFLDKDIEVSAITRQVQKAINAAVARTDLSQLKSKLAELKKYAEGVGRAAAPSATSDIGKNTQAYKQQAQSVQSLSKKVKQLAQAKQRAAAAKSVTRNEVQLLGAAELKTRELNNAFSKAGFSAEVFGARIAEIAKRFSGFFVYTVALFKFMEAMRFAADQMQLLNRTSADLAKVLKNNTGRKIEAAKDSLVALAIDTRRSFDEVATAMGGFVRQGLSLQGALQATQATMNLLNVSTIESATAQKLITVLMQSMGLSAAQAAEKIAVFSEVADNSASTVEDLAAGFSRAGSTATAFGITTEELAAAIGTVVAVTQLSATRVGTAFKTILSYTAANREQLLALAASYRGVTDSTNDIIASHQGVTETLKFVAQGWSDMDNQQKTAIGRLVGGKRRFNELAAIMGNFSKYEELLAKGMEKSDAIRRKSAIELQTLAAAHRELGGAITAVARVLEEAGITEFYRQFVLSVSGALQIFTQFVGSLQSVSKAFGTLIQNTKDVKIDDLPKSMQDAARNAEIAGTALSGFFSEALDGANLLKNVLIVTFVRVMLPSIAKATRSFVAMFSGNISLMKQVLGQETARTAQAAATVDQYQAQAQAMREVAAAANDVATAQQAATSAMATPLGGAKAAIPALGLDKVRVGMDKLSASLNTLKRNTDITNKSFEANNANAAKSILVTSNAAAGASKSFTVSAISSDKLAKAMQQSSSAAAQFTKSLKAGTAATALAATSAKGLGAGIAAFARGTGARIASTVALMQGLDAVSNALGETAAKIEETGEGWGTNVLRAGETVADTTAKFLVFGPKVAAAAGIVGLFGRAVGAAQEKLAALAQESEVIAQMQAERVNAEELIVAAQNDRLLAEALVSKGMARWIDELSPEGVKKRLDIDLEALPVEVDVRLLKASVLASIKKDLADIDVEANRIRETWVVMTDELKKSEASAQKLRKSLLDIASKSVEFEIEIAAAELPGATKQLKEFSSIMENLRTKGFEFRGGFEDLLGISEALSDMEYQISQVREGAKSANEAMADWGQNIEVTSPELEAAQMAAAEMKAEIEAVNSRMREYAEIASESHKVKTEFVVEGIYELNKVFDAIREHAVALNEQGLEPSTKEAAKLTEQLSIAARKAGIDLPAGAEKHVQALLQQNESLGDIDDRMNLLRQYGAEFTDELNEVVKQAQQGINLTEQWSKIEEDITKLKREQQEAARDYTIQLYSSLEIARKHNESLEKNLELGRQELGYVLETTRARQQAQLQLALMGKQEGDIAKARRVAAEALEDSRRKMEKLTAAVGTLYKQQIDQAALFEMTPDQIEPVLQTLSLELKAKLADETKNNIKEVAKTIETYINSIRDLEKQRFDIVKSEIQNIAQLERSRIDTAKEVSSALVKGLQAGGLSEAEIAQAINVGYIKTQLGQIDGALRQSLNSRQKIELAHALEMIDIKAKETEQVLKYELSRASDEAQAASIKAKMVSAANQRMHDRAIAISESMRQSVVDDFELIAAGVEKSVGKMREIAVVEKEIAKLRAQVEFVPPEDLATTAARKDSLEAQREELRIRLDQLRAFNEHNRALSEQRQALDDARTSADNYVFSMKRQLGLTMELNSAIGQISIASETAANMLFDTENTILRVRTENAQAALQVYQEQYNKLRSFGEQLYTASPSQIIKLAQANSLLQNSTLSMADTLAQMPLYLRDAAAQIVKLRFGEQGETMLAEAGLARVGAGADIMEQLQQKILGQATVIANEQVAQVEEQQRMANSMDTGVMMLERQLAQAEAGIAASEKAAAQIEELRQDLTKEDSTPEAQLREAIEQRKLLKGQLAYQQRNLQQNLANAGVMGPNLRSLNDNSREQIGHLKRTADTTVALKDTMDLYAAAMSKLAEQGLAGALTPLEAAQPAALDTEDLGAKIEADSQASQEVSAAILQLTGEITEYQQLQANMLTVYDKLAQTLSGNASALDAKLDESNTIIRESMAQFAEALNTTQGEVAQKVIDLGGGTDLGKVQNAIVKAINDLDIKINVNITRVQQQYGGGTSLATGLTNVEMGQVIAAARREKAKKPSGTDLVVANSSELVIRPDQVAKIFGQVNIPTGGESARQVMFPIERNVRPGTAKLEGAETIGSLLRKLDTLLSQQGNLMELAQKKKLFSAEQRINIAVDGKREVTVRGMTELAHLVDDAFRKNMSKFTSKAEHMAIKGLIENLIRRLRDAGIDGVY